MVELLVVIGIVGILAALGTFGGRGLLDRGRMSEALNVVTTDIEQARRLAKRLDQAVTFQLVEVDGAWRSIVNGEGRDLGAEVTSGTLTLTLNPPFGTFAGSQARVDLTVGSVSASVFVTGVLARTVVLR